jgi:hypothetical protein
MRIKQTSSYEFVLIYYILNAVNLYICCKPVYFLVTFCGHLQEVFYTGYIKNT